MRALLVVNPQATSTTVAGRDVLAHALASDVKLEVVETTCRGHAAELAAQAARDGVHLVIAHGGDGTVNEVVNGVLTGGPGPDVPMVGVVPGGSANVFARALGLPQDPVEATYRLLQAIESGRSREVGLGRAAGRWFTFNAGLGMDADVVAEVERWRTRGREATPALYVRAALTSYLRQRRHAPELTLTLADGRQESGVQLAFVSNTAPWTYLASRPIRPNPATAFDSGLGVFALRSLGVGTVARHVYQFLAGIPPHGAHLLRHDDVASVHVLAKEPVPLQIDGDHLGKRAEVEFEAVPRALRVAV